MSIESSGTKRTRSVRTLICPAAAGTGARGLLRSAGACPPQSLSGRVFLRRHCEGQALALRVSERVSCYVVRGPVPRSRSPYGSPTGVRRAGACPPRSLSVRFFFGACEGQALALRAPGRAFFSECGGCPPRSLSVRVFLRRHCEGQALALRVPYGCSLRGGLSPAVAPSSWTS